MRQTNQIWQHARRPLRDFCCAFVVFTALFIVMAPADTRGDAIPVISLFTMSSAEAGALAVAGANTYLPEVGLPSAARMDPAIVSTILALMFSTLVALNSAILRHLGRVYASSRRGAWRGS